jgi:Bacterial CdiA-CT RNAse A domain
MKTSVSFRSLRVLPCVLVGYFLFFLLGCNEFKQMTPKTQPAQKAPAKRKAPASGEDPEIEKVLAPEKEPDADVEAPRVTSEADHVTGEDFPGASRDLSTDERAGGHTLSKHVGRTDNELRERLAHEDISASSTYTDRPAAQFAVGNALQQNSNRIEQWMARSKRPNLVLDYHGNQPVGRTLHRGESVSRPCADAKIVLRWLSSSEYYVLTSYPECR